MSENPQTTRPRRHRAENRIPARHYAGREMYEQRRIREFTEDPADTESVNSTEISGFEGSEQREQRTRQERAGAHRDRNQAPQGKRKVRRGKMSRFPSGAALLLLCAGLLLGAVITFGIMKAGEQNRIQEAVAARSDDAKMQGIKESLSEGKSVLSTLRKAYDEDLIMYKDGKYQFLPIDHNLKMHSFTSENVSALPTGEWQYKDGDEVVSHKGIDVSSHQGEIDWKKVAEDGVEYAIIRAMYRGYGSGKLVEDTAFKENAVGATSNGINTGAYVFTQAISREEVEEEVEMLKGLLAPYNLEGPVVVDVEQTAEGVGRMDALDPDTRTDLIKYYCDLIKEAGYRPMIYYNIETALLMLDIQKLEDYEKWFATYNSDFYFPYDYRIWQYTDKGRVNGIDGNVDMDLIF